MKILHIINNLGSGGAERLISEMIPLINKEEDVEIVVLLLTDKDNVFHGTLEENKIKVKVIPLKSPRSPINIYYIKKHINEGEYDVVHAHLFPTIYWVSIASRLMIKNKPKFIYTEHSTYNRRRSRSYLRPLEKWIYSSYDKVISISDSTQENLIRWLKPTQRNLRKFVIINNGININKFKKAEPYVKKEISSKFTDDTKILCMVGRFSEAKDQATIIKAMKSLSGDTHLLLVGEGILKEQNEKLAKDIGVSDRVCFLGFRDDVERILKTSDIIIQSSNWEGFGLAAVEGMASGKPVIASDIEGLRNVVGGAGLLFERGNVKGLADKVNLLIGDNGYCKNSIEACLKIAFKYDIHILVNKVLKMYKDIV